MKNGAHLSQITVLVQAGFQTREFEERFIAIGLPYRVIGTRFYERTEIRDAIAYLRLIAQPADDLAFERIINTPKRGLGAAGLQAIHMQARARISHFWRAIDLCNRRIASCAVVPEFCARY